MLKALLSPGTQAQEEPSTSQRSPPPPQAPQALQPTAASLAQQPSAVLAQAAGTHAAPPPHAIAPVPNVLGPTSEPASGAGPAEQLMLQALLTPTMEATERPREPAVERPAAQLQHSASAAAPAAAPGGPPPPPVAPARLASHIAEQPPTGRLPAARWPRAATPEGVCGLLGYFPQLDEPCLGLLGRLAPQHALAILWDIDAKGGCEGKRPLDLISVAAQTLARARLAGLPAQPLALNPMPPPSLPACPVPVQLTGLARSQPQFAPFMTAPPQAVTVGWAPPGLS